MTKGAVEVDLLQIGRAMVAMGDVIAEGASLAKETHLFPDWRERVRRVISIHGPAIGRVVKALGNGNAALESAADSFGAACARSADEGELEALAGSLAASLACLVAISERIKSGSSVSDLFETVEANIKDGAQVLKNSGAHGRVLLKSWTNVN